MKSMEARYRLVCVAVWLRRWWHKQVMAGLFVLNVPCLAALFCDAMVRADAGEAPVLSSGRAEGITSEVVEDRWPEWSG